MKSFLKIFFPAINHFSQRELIQMGDYVANYYLLNEDRNKICPSCIDDKVKKNGTVRGTPRGICLCCGKSFSYGRPELMYRSRLPKDLWHDFIIQMFYLAHSEQCAIPKFDGINKNTAVRMHRKIMALIEEYIEDINDDMDEIVRNFSDEKWSQIIKKLHSW